ncbi:MAG: DsbE family thiol:disulfide interchange protein [Steroidobacteraceae bacterium]
MMRKTLFVLPGIAFILLAVFLVRGLFLDPSRIPSPLIGTPAPQFTLPDLGDPASQVTNIDWTGSPYLVNVWGTWCAGCREEHEVLLEIARENELPILGINWKDQRELALRWLAELGNPYSAVGADLEGRVAIDWGVYGAPETFLVGADGRVVWKHIGPLTLEAWRADFLPRLAGQGG